MYFKTINVQEGGLGSFHLLGLSLTQFYKYILSKKIVIRRIYVVEPFKK